MSASTARAQAGRALPPSPPSPSLTESLGYFDDPPGRWVERVALHRRQVNTAEFAMILSRLIASCWCFGQTHSKAVGVFS